MAGKMRVDYDDRVLRKNVRNFDRRLRNDVSALVDYYADYTTVWLKTNARWTDRTGAARTGLFAIANHGQTFEEIYMAYSVNYGIWLEVAHDRKYAIITPAIRIIGAELMASMNLLIDRMGKV